MRLTGEGRKVLEFRKCFGYLKFLKNKVGEWLPKVRSRLDDLGGLRFHYGRWTEAPASIPGATNLGIKLVLAWMFWVVNFVAMVHIVLGIP